MAHSLESVLFNRRLCKNNPMRRDNSNNSFHDHSYIHFAIHRTSSTPQNHNDRRKRMRYYNDKLASMAHSLESVLFNRRLRKNNPMHRDNSNNSFHHHSYFHFAIHPTSSTPQNHNDRRKRMRRKNTKRLPISNNTAPLDPNSVVNLSNITLTRDETQLLFNL